jgi:rhodanese-related sulfurtransferase
VGSLRDPIRTFLENERLMERSSRLTADQLAERISGIAHLEVVDVRNRGELGQGVIPGSKHIPLARLLERLSEIDRERPVVVYCAGGYRSSIAASVLAAAGFADVSDLLGGYEAWRVRAAR